MPTEKMLNTNQEKRIAMLQSVLGCDLYQRLYYVFTLFRKDKNYTHKLLMSRKCFSLYKAFDPILNNDGCEIEGTITNDKMIGVSGITKSSQVLVFDDTVLYGRTIMTFIETLLKTYQIPMSNISVSSVFASSDRLQNNDMKYPYFTNEWEMFFCFGEIKINVWKESRITFLSTESVRGNSAIFLDAIHSVSAPYVAYIPAFEITKEEAKEAIRESQKSRTAFTDTIDFHSRQEEAMLPVKCDYQFFLSNELSEKVSERIYSYIRIYDNPNLDMLTVIPHIIFPIVEECGTDELPGFDIYNKQFPKTSREGTNDADLMTRVTFLRFASSYLLGKEFFKKFNIKTGDYQLLNEEGYGKEEFINGFNKLDLSVFNFFQDEKTFRLLEEIPKSYQFNLDNSTNDVFVSIFNTNNLSVESVNRISDSSRKAAIFDTLSKYFYRTLIENREANRLPGTCLNSIISKFKCVKPLELLPAMIRIGEMGRANINTFVHQKKLAICIMQDGEQAAQVANEFCVGFTYALSTIYETLKKPHGFAAQPELLSSDKNLWEENKDILKVLLYQLVSQYREKENAFAIDKNDIDIIIDSDDPSQWHSDIVRYYVPANSEIAEFMVDFAFAFIDWVRREDLSAPIITFLPEQSQNYLERKNINLRSV
ncbi:MAG: hypothetical protein LBM69_02920 [Lachnospiraceae bacterium]|nr:hypothetical protein [Lachnospiraceae bacterium]